jgi:hypothetical protein
VQDLPHFPQGRLLIVKGVEQTEDHGRPGIDRAQE